VCFVPYSREMNDNAARDAGAATAGKRMHLCSNIVY